MEHNTISYINFPEFGTTTGPLITASFIILEDVHIHVQEPSSNVLSHSLASTSNNKHGITSSHPIASMVRAENFALPMNSTSQKSQFQSLYSLHVTFSFQFTQTIAHTLTCMVSSNPLFSSLSTLHLVIMLSLCTLLGFDVFSNKIKLPSCPSPLYEPVEHR